MCETCQNAEHNKTVSRKARPVKVESPWEVLGLDIHGECLRLIGSFFRASTPAVGKHNRLTAVCEWKYLPLRRGGAREATAAD